MNEDREIARESIRGSLSVFAHFSGFHGMDIDSLPEEVRDAARHLRESYDMKDHAVSAGAHAQALEAEFIHQFGIAEPPDAALARLREVGDTGLDYLRIVPGSLFICDNEVAWLLENHFHSNGRDQIGLSIETYRFEQNGDLTIRTYYKVPRHDEQEIGEIFQTYLPENG